MLLSQAQNLAGTLTNAGCDVSVTFDQFLQTWVVHATKPNSKVTSTQMTNIAAGVVPSSPAVTAQTDRAQFV